MNQRSQSILFVAGPRRPRRAFSIVEVSVATAMLGVLLVTSVQVLNTIAQHQRSTQRRALAAQTLQNFAELVETLPWDQLTNESLRIALSEQAPAHLPDASVSAHVVDESAPVAMKRVTVTLSWKPPGNKPPASLKLTTWVFPDSGT
jgi:hypothetical protein